MRLAFSWQAPVVAGILLLFVPVSWLSFLIIGVLLAAYESTSSDQALPR